MLATNPTNASVQYWLLSSSPETSASSSLAWGPTTSYQFTAISSQGVGTSSVTAFIDFLAPSTTYYYHVHAWTSCTDSSGTHSYTGDYYGSWTTHSDSMSAFSGKVTDSNGGTLSGGNMWVWAYCLNYPPGELISGSLSEWTSAYTNSAGHYSLGVPYWYDNQNGYDEPCTADGGGGYAISVVNYPLWYDNLNMGNSVWVGHWNETLVAWAPQFASVYLPLNFVGPYVPQELEFTSSPYVTLAFSESVGVTTSYSAEVAGSGGTTVSSFSATETGSATGSPVETWVKYYTSGTTEFNALTRVSSIPNTAFYGAIQSSTTQNLASDPISASSVGSSQCFSNGLWYSYTITPSQTRGGSVNMSGSVTYSTGLNLDIGISLDVPGSGVGVSASVPLQFGVSTTASYSAAFSFSVHNTDSVSHVFRAYVQGGTSTNTGIIVHVWQLS